MLGNIKLQFLNIGKYGGVHTDTVDFSSTPRPFFSVGMILDGKGDFYEQSSKIVSVSPGDIIVVPSAVTYVSHWIGSPNISYITFHFIFEKGFGGNIPIQKIGGFEYLKNYFEFAYDNFSSIEQSFKILAVFYNILDKIYPKIKKSSEKQMPASIKKAIDYITQNCTNDITIKELASIANLSQSRFFAVFKAETGMTPIEYKNSLVIRSAEKLLLTADLSVDEICEKLGFNSSSYFRRTFKAYTGKSPREYKNSIKTDLRL